MKTDSRHSKTTYQRFFFLSGDNDTCRDFFQIILQVPPNLEKILIGHYVTLYACSVSSIYLSFCSPRQRQQRVW